MVYINEAHAADVWNIGESAGAINNKHTTIQDRIGCANKLIEEFKIDIPIYCDNMDDCFESMFAAWPIRYFVIKNCKISLISNPENSEVDICELFDFLRKQ